jgi:hypothetical protein
VWALSREESERSPPTVFDDVGLDVLQLESSERIQAHDARAVSERKRKEERSDELTPARSPSLS